MKRKAKQRVRRRITRDTVFCIFGLSGIAYQQITGKYNIALILAYLALCGLTSVSTIQSIIKLVQEREEEETQELRDRSGLNSSTVSSQHPSPSSDSPS